METIRTPKDLYLELILDIYNAEVLQVPALQHFEGIAGSATLKKILHRHVINTRGQMLRLEDLVDELGASPKDDHCRTMKSMIKEAGDLVDRCESAPLKDAAIIISLTRINQCEQNAYSMLSKMAEELAFDGGIDLLYANWEEEKYFARKLKSVPLMKSLTQKTL